MEDLLIGSVVSKLFSEPDTYTVELEVSDGRGGKDWAGPETVLISARTVAPPDDGDDGDDGEEPEPPPGQVLPPDSADQRPPASQICGFGMILGFFGTLLGLTVMLASRRRLPC
jgi:hypothetical protein